MKPWASMLSMQPFTVARDAAVRIAREVSRVVSTHMEIIKNLIAELVRLHSELRMYGHLVKTAQKLHEAAEQALYTTSGGA